MGNEALEKFALERIIHAHTTIRLRNEKDANAGLRAAIVQLQAANEERKSAAEDWRNAYTGAASRKRFWRSATFVAIAGSVIYGVTKK